MKNFSPYVLPVAALVVGGMLGHYGFPEKTHPHRVRNHEE